MDTPPGSSILDPFSGAGTTLIEGRLEGHDVTGFEINPWLHFVCSTSLEWGIDADRASRSLEALGAILQAERSRHSADRYDQLGLDIPRIHNVERWWRPDVLKDLMLLLDAIKSCPEQSDRRFFELCLAGVLVPDLSNVTLGRLQLHFIERHEDEIRVWDTFESHAKTMIEDLRDVQTLQCSQAARVLLTDSTVAEGKEDVPPIDRVVTSPPYPNRYSYVWNTRPFLYLFGQLSTAKEASDLDTRTIGGTWGVATSVLAKGVIAPNCAAVANIVEPVAAQIRVEDNLMANYLMKYFNLLADQLRTQHAFLKPNARLAYVVGCSRLKGVYIETDVLLGRLFEELDLGYRTREIVRFRKRHSGKDLHESIVYADRV